eukprot:gene5240-10488_t
MLKRPLLEAARFPVEDQQTVSTPVNLHILTPSENFWNGTWLIDEASSGLKKARHLRSPVSVADYGRSFGFNSQEAPGRLQSDNKYFIRARSVSNLECEEKFCKLDTSLPNVLSADLPRLVNSADAGFKSGMDPHLVEDCMGGTYFLRDSSKAICVVFKPSDEEPFAPNNPRQEQETMGKHRPAYKGAIVPGFGMFRELAAFALDGGFCGVPPTHLAKVRHPVFKTVTPGDRFQSSVHGYKIGSVQSFVRSICTAEDMGPALFDLEDIQRMAIFDIRLCNLDRHLGNILVCHSNPYQVRNVPVQRSLFSGNKCSSSSSPPSSSNGNKGTTTTGYEKYPSSPPSSGIASSAPSQSSSFLLDYMKNEEEKETNSSSSRRYRLVPIDHGYCIPHILHMKEVTFNWMDWKETDQPLSDEIVHYISQLDPVADAKLLRRVVGAAIPEECLLTLYVCTRLLQTGISAGLSLRSIAKLMTTEECNEDAKSALQIAVLRALYRAFTRLSCGHGRKYGLTSYKSGIFEHISSKPTASASFLLSGANVAIDEDQLMNLLSWVPTTSRIFEHKRENILTPAIVHYSNDFKTTSSSDDTFKKPSYNIQGI